MKRYVLGLDFGTLSCRAVIVDALTGDIAAESVCEYTHGVMDVELPDGTPLPPQSAIEHPADYINAMKTTIADALAVSSLKAEDIEGVGVDFTACTLISVDSEAKPLCFYDEFKSDPNAYAKLWKSHSAESQAQRITQIAEERGERWLSIYGGKVSSEWMLPKVLQTLEDSPRLFEAADKFVEAGDWITRLLTGSYTYAVSFAGFKAMWNAEDGFPSDEYLGAVDERLRGIFGSKLADKVTPVENIAGYVSKQGAELFGLCEGTAVALPIIDAHAGLPGSGVKGEGELMMMLGTSGCYILSTAQKKDIAGIGGYTKGAVYPSIYTYEAGQCCFGDGFDWFVKNFVPESYTQKARENGINIHAYLRSKARELKIGESGLMVLDWFNGNRSVLCDSDLSGMILGLTLTTKPEHIYRALLEGVAFGAKMIIDNYTDNGIKINRVVATGGIALKDELLMQILSDVTGLVIEVSASTQACALGSAMYGAVACGIYSDVRDAATVMSKPTVKTYMPIEENTVKYRRLYDEYKLLHDYFGRGENDVMKRLLGIARKS